MGTEVEVIEHTVTVADATVTQFGFGIPLIAANHNYWPELVRAFDTAAELTRPPFNVPTSSALYQAALKLKSQQPSPPQFKVGKLSGTYVHTVKLTPAAPTAPNTRYTVTVDATAVSVTFSPPSTATDVATALVTAINAITDVTATSAGAVVTVVGDTADVTHSYLNVSANITFEDATIPGTLPTADLTAIRAFDGDWYAFTMLLPGNTAITNAAQWAETERALFLADSSDAAVPATPPGDIASTLQGLGYHRTALWYSPAQGEYLASAVAGAVLPKLPGPITWANKGLVGETMQLYDATQRNAFHAKNANFYLNIKGLGFTREGTAASGRYLDVTSTIDWFDVQLEDRIISTLRNNDVVPYTASGIELIRTQILGCILDGITAGLIDGEQPYSATAPALASIDPTLIAGRILPDMRYSYRLSGAIHKVRVNGTVQV